MQESIRSILFNPATGKLIAAAVAVVVIFALSHILQRGIAKRIADVDNRYRARKLVTLASYVLTVAAVATVYSDRLGGLTVAFGMAGAGVAFALQEVIASMAGWIAISVGGFYSPGDRVQLGGVKGDVIDISILRTTLMEIGEWVDADLYTGRIVRVANSFVFKAPVFNYSGQFPFLWDEIKLPVKYGSDWTLARSMLRSIVDETLLEYAKEVMASWKQLVREYRVEDANIEPMITLRATDNWIEFTIRYVVDFRKRRWMKDHLFTRILEEIDKSEGRIRLASETFELVPGSALDVNLRDPGQAAK